jgi:hypothetical protein
VTLAAVEYVFPPIYCPLEAAVNPHAEKVGQQAEAWVAASGMCSTERERRSVIATHSADFFGRFAPQADADRLLASALWVYWGFAFDDARCDNGPLSASPAEFIRLAGRVQRAVEAPSATADGERFIPPLQDIVARFRSVATPVQVARFAAAHRAWLCGVSWQIGNQASGRMPELDEYLAMRLLSSGGEPTFALLEIASGEEVPDRELYRPAVRALKELAIMVAALDNDRHSLRRELGERTDQNIYAVLMRHCDLDPAEAIEKATRIRDGFLLRFLDLYERILPRAGAALGCYLKGLSHGIRGNAEWGLRVPRYLDLGGELDAVDESLPTWAERPLAGQGVDPLQLPSVAWWWDEDLV